MTVVLGNETLVFNLGHRRAVRRLVLELVALVLVVLASAAIVGRGPVVYPGYSRPGSISAGIAVVLILVRFVLGLTLDRKGTVVLTPEGVDPGPAGPEFIAWSDIVSVHTRWSPRGRHVLLTRRDDQPDPVQLFTPTGSAWLPDPVFDRELDALRQWADRYGTGIEHDGRNWRWPQVVTGLVILAVLTTSGVRAAERGTIWPWTAIVTTVTSACPALRAAGLDRFRPAHTRALERDQHNRDEAGEYSNCSQLGQDAEVSDARLNLAICRHATGRCGEAVRLIMQVRKLWSTRNSGNLLHGADIAFASRRMLHLCEHNAEGAAGRPRRPRSRLDRHRPFRPGLSELHIPRCASACRARGGGVGDD